MQDYYNTIPAFGVGGLIAKIAKAAGRAKIQEHANLLSKEQPELSNLLSKLAKSLKGGSELSKEESKKLVTLAQNYRKHNINYQNRRNKIREQIAAKRNPTPKPTEAPTEQPARSANPVKGTTLSSRWQQAKTWMNNHPKTTIGVPIFAASGIGRDILGGAWSAYNSHPFSSDSEDKKQKSVVTIDGVDIPITMGNNGKFIVDTTGSKKPKKTPEDDIDSLIDAAKATPTTPSQPVPNTPNQNVAISDQNQQMINDLFPDDQWD